MNSIEYNFGVTLGTNYLSPQGVLCGTMGPEKMSIARPAESGGVVMGNIHAENNYILLSDNSTAAATRRFVLYKDQGSLVYLGYITATMPSSGTHTIRDVKLVFRTLTYNASTSGTSITGTGSDWLNLFPGSRFCLTDTPTDNTVWYEISTISSNTSAVSTTTLPNYNGTITIQDMRIVFATTCSTATNGGLFVVAGLRPELFITSGTVISAGVTTNTRAVYWLADAATVTNTTAAGIALETITNNSTQYCYVINGGGTTSAKIYKYNILGQFSSLSAGKTTNNYILQTGTQIVVGNVAASGNICYATVGHGVAANQPSTYFITSSRVYRCKLTDIVLNSTTFVTDSMTEASPVSTSAYPATNAFFALGYSPLIDKFVITTTSKNYITSYYTSGENFDHYLNVDYRVYNPSTISDLPSSVSNAGVGMYVSCNGYYTYLVRNQTIAANNQLYKIPIALDYNFNRSMLISPRLSFIATKLGKLYINTRETTGNAIKIATEPFRVFWRTNGIEDNTGTWSELSYPYDLSGVIPVGKIQFAFDFRSFGTSCYSTDILGFCLTYQDINTIPYELEWDIESSDIANGIVGFYQKALFSPAIPTLTIRYHNSTNDVVLFSQTSDLTSNGFFQYWNGSSWQNGVGPNVIGTKRRFLPTSGLPNNTRLYVSLGQ